MRGDEAIVTILNEQLTSELTSINQYFVHAKMQGNWGYTRMAQKTREESIEEMVHAEHITDRILFLDGLPNYQRLLPLRIGQTVREQFEADLSVEKEAVERLQPAIGVCREKGDATTANLLEGILKDEEDHVDYLETQLGLMERLGEQLYLAQLVEQPPTNG